jgi:DNA-binding IscR family transcriptional regulator
VAATSTFTLAVHALCWMEQAARQRESPLTSERIADSLASQPALVRRILAPLREAGIVVTGRGPGSGWALAIPAQELTLDRVRAALGGEAIFALHPHEPKDTCVVGHGIRPVLSSVYASVDRAIAAELARHSIADVLTSVLRDHPLPGPARTAMRSPHCRRGSANG